MSTPAIDYDALAAQHGGSATVDYDALAAQHGGAVAASSDGRNAVQRFVDNLTTVTPEQEKGHSALVNQAQKFGAGAIQGFTQPFVHPLDTLTGIGNMVSHPIDTGKAMVQSAISNPAQTAGNLVGGSVLGEAAAPAAGALAKSAAPAAGKVATAVGDAAQDAGTGLINKTVGTLKNDFKRGANPARGYLKSRNGPALSMTSLAEKGEAALDDIGSQLGDAYKTATATGKKIPVEVVAQEMAKPIQKAIDLETGPGGTGNLASIKSYVDQFAPAFEKAAQNGGFTPSELFKMKRSIAENTNWSDPAQFSLKAVRQQQTGALSGILSDAVPETADLNQMYQDLTKFTNRAKERANTGSRPLTAHIYKAGMASAGALAGAADGHPLLGLAAGAVMDSVPAKTALASGLFRGGKALSSLGERLSPAESAAVEDVASSGLSRNGQNYKAGNPQITPQMLREAAIQRFLAAQNRQ